MKRIINFIYNHISLTHYLSFISSVYILSAIFSLFTMSLGVKEQNFEFGNSIFFNENIAISFLTIGIIFKCYLSRKIKPYTKSLVITSLCISLFIFIYIYTIYKLLLICNIYNITIIDFLFYKSTFPLPLYMYSITLLYATFLQICMFIIIHYIFKIKWASYLLLIPSLTSILCLVGSGLNLDVGTINAYTTNRGLTSHFLIALLFPLAFINGRFFYGVDILALLNSMDPVVIASKTGMIIAINNEFTKKYGWHNTELVGKPLTIFMPERYKASHEQAIDHLNKGGKSKILGKSVKAHLITPQNIEIPIKLNPNYIDQYNPSIGFCAKVIPLEDSLLTIDK